MIHILPQSALLTLTLALAAAAEEPCACQLDPISGRDSVAALCTDLDLEQVPACVPNNTRVLTLSGNVLHELAPHALQGLAALENLVADRCHLSRVAADALRHSPSLRTLILARNSLHELPAAAFDSATQLQTVDLSHNMLHSLPRGLFGKLQGLRSLDLSHNYLSALPGDLVGGCAPQSSLRLAHNLLTGLPVEIIRSCSSLYTLDASANKMTQMAPDTVVAIGNLSDLHSLHLEENAWHCNCSLYPLYQMLLSHSALERHLTCASPRKWLRKHVVHVMSGLECTAVPSNIQAAEPSAHTAQTLHKNNAGFVALAAVGTVSLVLSTAFFVVRHYFRVRSSQFSLLNNADA